MLDEFKEELSEVFSGCEGLRLPQKEYCGKIVWQTLARTGNAFIYDNNGFFAPNSTYIMTSDNENLKYVLSVLNSKIMLWYLDSNFAKLDETGWQWIKENVEKLPIPKITSKNQNLADSVVKLVEQILTLKERNSTTDTSHLEREIDNLVFKLYGLTKEQISLLTQ